MSTVKIKHGEGVQQQDLANKGILRVITYNYVKTITDDTRTALDKPYSR